MKLQEIHTKIHELRNSKACTERSRSVMLDFDLAVLYEVETRVLKQAVRRNLNRFPADFMFQLTEVEVDSMVSQFVIPSKNHLGGALPFTFTEQSVATVPTGRQVLSTVLRSEKAIEVNISIMRAFVQLRRFALDFKELADEIKRIENKMDKKFSDIYQALDYLINDKKKKEAFDKRKQIGFVK